jgi:hypothetical protein
LDLLAKGTGSECIGIQDAGKKILCFIHQCQPLPLQLQENIAHFMVTTKDLHHGQDTECVQISVSFYHS